jgi:hypothetical protein
VHLDTVATLNAALADMSSDSDTELELPPPSPFTSPQQEEHNEEEDLSQPPQPHDDQQADTSTLGAKNSCAEESDYESASDSSYTGSNDSSECATITLLERDLERPPARAAAAEAKNKMVDRVQTGPDFEDEEEECKGEGQGGNNSSCDLTNDAATEALAASETLPLAVTDPNAADASGLNTASASGPQRITPAKKMKRLYNPAFDGKAPDPEDAGFALFHDKQGRDCR